MDQDDTAAAIAVSAETAPEKSTAPAIRSFSRKNFKLNVLGSKVYSTGSDFDSKEADQNVLRIPTEMRRPARYLTM